MFRIFVVASFSGPEDFPFQKKQKTKTKTNKQTNKQTNLLTYDKAVLCVVSASS